MKMSIIEFSQTKKEQYRTLQIHKHHSVPAPTPTPISRPRTLQQHQQQLHVELGQRHAQRVDQRVDERAVHEAEIVEVREQQHQVAALQRFDGGERALEGARDILEEEGACA